MTLILCEVFPVTLVSKSPALIQHAQEKKLSPWIIPHLSHTHPNNTVIHHLLTFFNDAFDSRHMIVHSTSWRFEHECDRLLLTYLAVLPQGYWLDRLIANQHISLQPIGAVATQYGDHLFPPAHIEHHAALAHALDHLASLSTYDPAIQVMLEPGWREALQTRLPKPAGYLQEALRIAIAK
jgi:hypothetical protein